MGTVGKRGDEVRDSVSVSNEIGAFLTGSISRTMTVSDLLARNPKLHSKTETINGTPCLVLEGVSEEGEVTAWIAPDKGWNFLKYVIRQSGDHLSRGRPLRESGIKEWTYTVDDIHIEKVGDSYLPVSGIGTESTVFEDGRKGEVRIVSKYTEIDLAPNFDALKAFQLELPDGTVLEDQASGLQYEVRSGQVVPRVSQRDLTSLEDGIGKLKTLISESETNHQTQVHNSPAKVVAQLNETGQAFFARWVVVFGCAGGVIFVGFLLRRLAFRRSKYDHG